MIVYVHEIRGEASVGAHVVGPTGRVVHKEKTVEDALDFIDRQPNMELAAVQPQLEPGLQPEGPETIQQRVRRIVRERLKEAS